jgi:hypothetical protein
VLGDAGQVKINALVEDWTKNAPAGSEAAVVAIKQAIASATNVFETSQKAVKHAVEITQTNLSNANSSVEKTIKAASKPASKASKKK